MDDGSPNNNDTTDSFFLTQKFYATSSTGSLLCPGDGETLLVISLKDRTWWKNLQGGAQVTVFQQGHALQAHGEAFTDTETVAKILLLILQRVPGYQRLYHLKLDASGQPEHPQDLTRLAQDRVIVRVRELTARVT